MCIYCFRGRISVAMTKWSIGTDTAEDTTLRSLSKMFIKTISPLISLDSTTGLELDHILWLFPGPRLNCRTSILCYCGNCSHGFRAEGGRPDSEKRSQINVTSTLLSQQAAIHLHVKKWRNHAFPSWWLVLFVDWYCLLLMSLSIPINWGDVLLHSQPCSFMTLIIKYWDTAHLYSHMLYHTICSAFLLW
jgi:hypothetical protein